MGNDKTVPPLRTGDSRKPAPDDLVLVQGFINTRDLEDDEEDLPDATALGRWLAHYGLMPADASVSDADYRQAIRVREALRAVLIAKNGGDAARDAIDALTAAAKTAELLVHFGSEGDARLVPVRGAVDGAIGRLLAIAHEADVEGTWQRLKVCPAEDCLVAFYDKSRNHSAVWCDMAVCGNRAKVREYRERRLKTGA